MILFYWSILCAEHSPFCMFVSYVFNRYNCCPAAPHIVLVRYSIDLESLAVYTDTHTHTPYRTHNTPHNSLIGLRFVSFSHSFYVRSSILVAFLLVLCLTLYSLWYYGLLSCVVLYIIFWLFFYLLTKLSGDGPERNITNPSHTLTMVLTCSFI